MKRPAWHLSPWIKSDETFARFGEWPIDGGIVAKIVTALGLPIIVQVVVVLITHLVSI